VQKEEMREQEVEDVRDVEGIVDRDDVISNDRHTGTWLKTPYMLSNIMTEASRKLLDLLLSDEPPVR
jgi:hypothetical protein